jgi:hypothetical protein
MSTIGFPVSVAPEPAGDRVNRRSLLWALLAIAAVAIAAVGGSIAGTSTHTRRVVGPSSHSQAHLSTAANLAVSRGLGADLTTYRVAQSPGGLLARNARQGLTARFGASGATVSTRDGAHAGIVLQAIGSGAVLHTVGLAQPLAHGNRVEYSRGAATEWFANGPAGVEQGFTIATKPAGAASGALTLALGLSGTLTARPGAGGGLVLTGASGKAVLRYGDLSVTDASGRSLPAHMTVAHGRVLISVDARGARYPLTVDPLVQDAELTNSTEEGEGDFGFSVAIDGSTIVVGATEAKVDATEHQGAAYVFTEPGGGWSGAVNQVAELTNNSGGPYTNFGWSVAISGKTIVVGARNVGVEYGAVYEFTEPAGGWTGTLQPTATLATPGGFGYDLGYSVAISGSTVVAGAPDAETTGGGSKQGLVEVFSEPGGGWKGTVSATANLTSSASESNGEEFGDAVAISEKTIVVGAPGAIIPGQPQQLSDSEAGAAYVFTEPGGGWKGSDTPAAALTEEAVGDRLGFAVALDGEDTVFADEPCAPKGCTEKPSDPGVDGAPGVVYIYAKPGGGWASTSKPTGALTDAGEPEPVDLGESLAADGSTVVAGAPLGGFVDVFDEPGGGWASEPQSGQFPAPSGAFDLGFAVGVSGETPVATAFFHITKNGQPSGAAFVFGLPLPPPTVVTEPASPVGETTTTLTGTVNPNGLNVTECNFEWGTSSSYGNLAPCSSAPGSGTSAVTVSATLIGLSAGETYYYRLVATNSSGTSKGLPQELTTATAPYTKSPPESLPAGTTTTPTVSTTTTSTPSTSTSTNVATSPKAIEELLNGCSGSPLVLNDVYIQGTHVEIRGSAIKSYVGKKVKILFNEGKSVATATVETNGQYTTTAPLPPAKIRDNLDTRYTAEIGKLRSVHLKLVRRLLLEPPKASGTTITLTGQLTLPLTKPIAPVTIEQQLECGKTTVAKTFTPSANGHFDITLTVPANAKAGIFRLTSKVAANKHSVAHGFTTFSLPLPVAIG